MPRKPAYSSDDFSSQKKKISRLYSKVQILSPIFSAIEEWVCTLGTNDDIFSHYISNEIPEQLCVPQLTGIDARTLMTKFPFYYELNKDQLITIEVLTAIPNFLATFKITESASTDSETSAKFQIYVEVVFYSLDSPEETLPHRNLLLSQPSCAPIRR